MSEYFYVRALASGPWSRVDKYDPQGNKIAERTLVMALETGGRWNIDNRSVDVVPGLVVSFDYAPDAEWFLVQERARWITAERGMCFAFEAQSDAEFFVRTRLAEAISKSEAFAAWGIGEIGNDDTEDEFPDDGTDDEGADGGDTADDTTDDNAGKREEKVSKMDKPKLENKAMKGGAENKKAAPAPKPAAKAAGKKGK